jgi:hypothetical protein
MGVLCASTAFTKDRRRNCDVFLELVQAGVAPLILSRLAVQSQNAYENKPTSLKNPRSGCVDMQPLTQRAND